MDVPFADFYHQGRHRGDDPFGLMEAHSIKKKGIELSRNIDHFAFLRRHVEVPAMEEFHYPVRGPRFFVPPAGDPRDERGLGRGDVHERLIVNDVDVLEDAAPPALADRVQRRHDNFLEGIVDQIERTFSGVDQQIELLPYIIRLRELGSDRRCDAGAPRGKLFRDVKDVGLRDLSSSEVEAVLPLMLHLQVMEMTFAVCRIVRLVVGHCALNIQRPFSRRDHEIGGIRWRPAEGAGIFEAQAIG